MPSCIARYYAKHFITNHKDKLKQASLEEGVKGRKVAVYIKSDTTQYCYCCFGCNIAWKQYSAADTHFETCKNKEQHKKICRDLLSEMRKPTTPASSTTNNEVEELKQKLSKLQSEKDSIRTNLTIEKNEWRAKFNRYVWAVTNVTQGQATPAIKFLLEHLNNPDDSYIDWDEILSEPPTAQYDYNKDYESE